MHKHDAGQEWKPTPSREHHRNETQDHSHDRCDDDPKQRLRLFGGLGAQGGWVVLVLVVAYGKDEAQNSNLGTNYQSLHGVGARHMVRSDFGDVRQKQRRYPDQTPDLFLSVVGGVASPRSQRANEHADEQAIRQEDGQAENSRAGSFIVFKKRTIFCAKSRVISAFFGLDTYRTCKGRCTINPPPPTVLVFDQNRPSFEQHFSPHKVGDFNNCAD